MLGLDEVYEITLYKKDGSAEFVLTTDKICKVDKVKARVRLYRQIRCKNFLVCSGETVEGYVEEVKMLLDDLDPVKIKIRSCKGDSEKLSI